MTVLNEFSPSDVRGTVDNLANVIGKFGDRFLPIKNPKSNHYLGGSIANYASDLTMTFPMLIDNSLDPEICSMISRANERNIVTMLHLLFSSQQFNGTDGKEIIQRIYGKMSPNMSMDDFIDKMDTFADSYANESTVLDDAYLQEAVNAIIEDSKKTKFSYEANSLSERALSDYTVRKQNGETVVKEDDRFVFTKHGFAQRDRQQLVDKDGNIIPNFAKVGDQQDYNDALYKDLQVQNALNTRRDYKRNMRQQLDIANQKAVDQLAMNKYSTYFDTINKRILDTDIKKANELQPTLMVVQYNELDADSSKIFDRKTFVTGVKSRLIPVDPADIVDRIVVKNKTKVSFVNFIRATTGEIKFFKDFIFSLDQAKIDAKNSIKKGEAAQMWKALENFSIRNNINKMRKLGNDASAITTLVINKETANLLKKQFKYDIEQPRNAKAIIEAYNLLGIFIVDESTESVKVLYRGNSMFEQQAFSYLEKEANDKSYKKVINLMGQMNRGY